MAAPVYSPYVSVPLSARQALATGNLDGEWLSDDELLDFAVSRALGVSQSNYRFDKVSVGSAIATPATLPKFFWRSRPRRHTYLLDISFTGLTDCTYGVNCSGSIIVKAGTDGRDYIDVTGTQVAFNLMMVDLLTWMMATDKCKEISQSAGGGSWSPSQVYDQCVDMAALWQGVSGCG